MKVSLAWLREFVELPESLPELTELLTLAGVEVEGVAHRGADFPKVVVAQILESAPHPNADRLSVCKVDAGSGELAQIVCGAKNYKAGDKAPLALPGAVLPGEFKIKIGKLRGVESQGMLCSSKELGLGEGEEGLLILPPGARVGAPLSELYPPDVVLDLEITPNRPDLLSHFGMAREIAALRGATLKSLASSGDVKATAGPVSIVAGDVCSFYAARRIRGVKVAESPAWLRARLESVGLRPINNIVDITNFVMMEMGQPLHAFDEAQLSGGLQVRRAAASEEFLALDGKSYRLGGEDLVIADEKGAVAVAGVMGGELSGVTGTTVNVVLESALFAPASVRKTSRRLGLLSDSSYRFERGIDPAGVLAASQRAAALIVEIAGGIAEQEVEVAGALPLEARKVRLRQGRASALLGIEIPEARAGEILTNFGLRKEEPDQWLIPSYRQDLSREVDLIEEITRAFGIGNIHGTVSGQYAATTSADAAHDVQMRIRRFLAGCGFYEARNFSLVSEAAVHDVSAAEILRIRNPLLEDQAVLRPELLPGLLQTLLRNLRVGARSIRLFEIGRVFRDGAESIHVAAILTGASEPASWRNTEPRPADFFDLKGVLEGIGFESPVFTDAECAGLLPAQSFSLGGEAGGVIGQLAPARVRALDLQQPVAVFEACLSGVRLRGTPERIAPLAKFPSVTRDIAVIVSNAVPHAQVSEVMTGANEPLLARVELFDSFSDPSGARVPAGQKSLAYSLTYRSAERTLTADEVNAVHARLKDRLKAAMPVSFRE